MHFLRLHKYNRFPSIGAHINSRVNVILIEWDWDKTAEIDKHQMQ